MLSAIIRTTDEAKTFANSTYTHAHLGTENTLQSSRATLVVVPSPCKSRYFWYVVIKMLMVTSAAQWMGARNQIVNWAPVDLIVRLIFTRHCTCFSNFKIYHSHGREGNAGVLADSDIVLSTYHTISYESTDKASPLWKIKWFRIILDEGRSSTAKTIRYLQDFI